MIVRITVNTGNYESISIESDNIEMVQAYIQVRKELEQWAGNISRCAWWIAKINQILANRGAPT